MARVAGLEIPNEKRLWVSLLNVYGVGEVTSKKICKGANVDENATKVTYTVEVDNAPDKDALKVIVNVNGDEKLVTIGVGETFAEFIVDVREDFEYNSGHVPNAKNIPLSQLEERYTEITDGTYLICQSGARSARACQYLSAKGIDTINISGGTIAWNGPLEFTDRF